MNRGLCGSEKATFVFRCTSKLVKSSINSHRCIIKLSTLAMVCVTAMVTGVYIRFVYKDKWQRRTKKVFKQYFFHSFLSVFLIAESISMLKNTYSHSTKTSSEFVAKYRHNTVHNERPSGTNECICSLSLSQLLFSLFKVKHCSQVTFPFSLSEMSAYVLWGAILIVTNTYKSGCLLPNRRFVSTFIAFFFPILHLAHLPRPLFKLSLSRSLSLVRLLFFWFT